MNRHRVFEGQRGVILAIVFASLCLNLLVLTAPIYMLQLFSRVLSSGSMATLLVLTIAAGIALFFFMIFDSLRQRIVSRLGNRLEADLGPIILHEVVQGKDGGKDTQAVRDLHDVRSFVMSSAFTALLDAPWSVFFVALIYLFHPLLGVVATIGLLILIALGVISEITGRGPAKKASEAGRSASRTADEILRNAEMVRAMGKTEALTKRWQKQSFAAIASGTSAHDRIADMTSAAKMVRMMLQIAIMATGVVLVLGGHMGPGMMIAASILLGRAAAPVEQTIAGWRGLIQARIALRRLNDLLGRHQHELGKMEMPEPQGRLSVEDASFVAPAKQDPIFLGVTFQLNPGDSLGLFGPSGAGKTSLARALVGLQPLTRGHVRIDDASLTEWPSTQIGRYIGFLPQRVDLFEGTIAENIATMDGDAKPSDIVHAAKQSCVHDLILSLPGGYNAQVGPSGNFLSAGQRQRIGLARAFFGSPCLIVLDEPNANLDPEGEAALAEAIERATASGAVVIVVSHRMSVLRSVNHFGIMEKGRLIRFGKAKAMMNDENIVEIGKRVSPDDTAAQKTVMPLSRSAGLKEKAAAIIGATS